MAKFERFDPNRAVHASDDLTAFTAGLWQVIFGKRNLILVWIMLALGGIFFIIGTIVRYLD